MTPSDPEHPDLEELLDEAGDFCQPRGPGWDSLMERLPPRQPQRPPEPPQPPAPLKLPRQQPGRWRNHCRGVRKVIPVGCPAISGVSRYLSRLLGRLAVGDCTGD